MPVRTETEQIDIDVERPRLISWPAIFAGLVAIIGGSWLLYLLGLALGVSIADATDMGAFGNGLGLGAIIWMLLSAIIVFFLGAMLTARLTGKTDDTVGMLHGVTLWGAGTTLMLVLGFMGLSNLLQTGQSFLGATARTTVQTVSAVGSGAAATADTIAANMEDLADTRLVNNLQARLKRRAADTIAAADAPGGADVRQREVRRSIEQLDDEALQDIATHLVTGETQRAKDTLADETALNRREINDIIDGISRDVQEMLGTADNDTDLAGDLAREFRRMAAGVIADADARGGPEVNREEVRAALRDLDGDTLYDASMRLLNGDEEGAKDILAARTALSEREIDDIVDGVSRDVNRTIDEYQVQFANTVEAASDYSQAVLWTSFGAAAISLVVSIFGGWMGTEATRQIEVRRVRVTPPSRA